MTPSLPSTSRLLSLLAATLSLVFAASARADFVYSQTFVVNQTLADFGEFSSNPVLSGLSGQITDVNVGIVLTAASGDAAWSGDYFVTLGHDTGFAVLLNRIGKTATNPYGSGHNGFNILLDDQAIAGDIHLATYNPASLAPGHLTGTWGPDARQTDPAVVVATDPRTGDPAASLASFNGLSADGQWRLFISDEGQGGNGVLSSWSLRLTLAPGGTSLNIGSGGTLTVSSTDTLAGALVNQGLIVVAGGEFLTFSGAVSGAGRFRGNFAFAGSYSPGNSPAEVEFDDGEFFFASTHILIMEIGGPDPGSDYDVITGSGDLILGGTLEIVFINGFNPFPTDVFNFFPDIYLEGAFETLLLPGGYEAIGNVLEGDSFSFVAIPEPASFAALAAVAVLACALWRRRLR